MKNIATEIYDRLLEVDDNVYFNQLPDNVDVDNVQIVYELNVEDSANTIDEVNYSNTLKLTIKILDKSVPNLFDIADNVSGVIFPPTTNVKVTTFKNSVPVFYDEQLQTNQYTLVYNIVIDREGFKR